MRPMLPEILGTKRGIDALSYFLTKHAAFTRTGKTRVAQDLPIFENEPEVNPDSDGKDDESLG